VLEKEVPKTDPVRAKGLCVSRDPDRNVLWKNECRRRDPFSRCFVVVPRVPSQGVFKRKFFDLAGRGNAFPPEVEGGEMQSASVRPPVVKCRVAEYRKFIALLWREFLGGPRTVSDERWWLHEVSFSPMGRPYRSGGMTLMKGTKSTSFNGKYTPHVKRTYRVTGSSAEVA
jgi:hypothetical protein